MNCLNIRRQLAALGACLMLGVAMQAQPTARQREYTTEHPLVYEDVWNLWPYCYLNEHGEPEGYNVDLVKALCEIAGIPYTIILKPTRQAVADLREGRSDLMLGLDNRNEEAGMAVGKTVVHLFTHSVVHVVGHDEYVRTVDDLARQKAIVHKGSYCHYLMESKGWGSNALPEVDMKSAIKQLSTEATGQIVWNTMSLKWLMRKYQTHNLVMTPVEMPHGTYRFMSPDTALLAKIDAAYTTLSMDGHRLESMQNRWFYPEQQDSGIPSWVWYVAAGVGAVALVLLFFNLFYRYRERQLTSLIHQNTDRLAHILSMSNMSLWTYDVTTRTFHLADERQQNGRKLTPLEFSSHMSGTDFERLCDELRNLASGQAKQTSLELRSTTPYDPNGELRDFSVQLSVLRRNAAKTPTAILGTMSDITTQRQRQQRAKMLLSRYRSIFENAMVDMVYYDSRGFIANMNKRAVHTFGMTLEKARQLKANLVNIFEDDEAFCLQTFTHFHVTRTLKVYNKFLEDDTHSNAKILYELQLVPVRDDDGRLLGIYGTGREVTDFVNQWKQRKQNIAQLRAANSQMGTYMKNIDYVMKVGGVRIAAYSPYTHMLTVYKETNVVQQELTQSRCLTLLTENARKRALKLFDTMDSLTDRPVAAELVTNLRSGTHAMHLQVNFVPVNDATGKLVRYFGLCRDVTEIKVTEQQLAKETVRAREVEELKNSFLRNMSYEIRTPLNAVVGFAELFERSHRQEDEPVFVEQIKNNAAYLLRLINDILFLSRLDAHMIEIAPQPVDFAQTFEAHCTAGWIHHRQTGVRFAVHNHFNKLVVEIDDTNVGRIIEQVAANAAQHTPTGQVRARYDYFDGKLMIAIEDTGNGIAGERLKHVFERFNSSGNGGTGLGLPICRELAQQMGGQIDITSTVGYGTTVWIVIPCKLVEMERKLESYTTA